MVIMTVNRRQILLRAAWLCLLTLMLTLAVTPRGKALFATGDGQGPLTKVPDAKGKVALTFDATWGTAELTKILKLLEGQNVKATFFVGGSFLSHHGELVQRMAAQGHEIGTAGQKIVPMSHLTEQEVVRELMASQSLIAKAVGRPARYFRPPLDEPTEAALRGATSAKLVIVTQSVESKDYSRSDARDISRTVLRGVGPGDIVRFSASDFSPETAKALPEILAGLKAKGLTPVILSDLVDLSDKRGH